MDREKQAVHISKQISTEVKLHGRTVVTFFVFRLVFILQCSLRYLFMSLYKVWQHLLFCAPLRRDPQLHLRLQKRRSPLSTGDQPHHKCSKAAQNMKALDLHVTDQLLKHGTTLITNVCFYHHACLKYTIKNKRKNSIHLSGCLGKPLSAVFILIQKHLQTLRVNRLWKKTFLSRSNLVQNQRHNSKHIYLYISVHCVS